MKITKCHKMRTKTQRITNPKKTIMKTSQLRDRKKMRQKRKTEDWA